MKIQILAKHRGFCVGVWNMTVVHLWEGPPTLADARVMVRACEKLLDEGHRNVTTIGIVARKSPPPEPEVRKVLAHWSQHVVSRMAGAVLVAEGGGFRAALVRGVGLALTTFAPHKIPFQFFDNVDSAIAALAPHLAPSSGGPVGLARAIRDLRAELES